MPLRKGSSEADVSANIAELIKSGRPAKQAEAIAYRVAGKDVALDMSNEDWNGLLGGLIKFFTEEEEEPEHREGAQDALALDKDSVRTIDDAGRMHVARANLSKACVSPYYGREIPDFEKLGLDSDKIYHLLRDPKELEKAADTSNGVQLMIRHVPVSAEDHKPDEVVGSVGTSAEYNHPFLQNELVIWPQYAIDAVEDGEQKELSCGYKYTPDMTSGVYEGAHYDGVMRDLKFNHVALVSRGRAGPECVVGDEAIVPPHKTEITMTKPIVLSRTAARVQGALAAYLLPKLAMDSAPKLDAALAPILKNVNRKNLKAKRAEIWKGAKDAAEPMMTPEAKKNGIGPDDVIMRVLDMVEGQVQAEPEEMDEMPEASTTANSATPEGYKAKVMEALKAKGMDEAACKEVMDMMPDAEDEETEEEKAERERKEKEAKDAEMKDMVPKAAMDAALKANTEATETRVMARINAIHEAREFVKPWAGDLPMALDSAEAVLRAALDIVKVPHKGLHVDSLRPILQAQPKPGERRSRLAEDTTIAMDAGATADFAKRFPAAANIQTL